MYQTSIRNKKKHSLFNQNKSNDYVLDEEYEEYAYVIKILGNCRVIVISNSGSKNIGIIRGSLRKFNKRILIEKSDLVVISKREYQSGKVDIVHKFNSDQCNVLIKENKLNNLLINLYNNKNSYEDIMKEDLEKDNILNDHIIMSNYVEDENTNETISLDNLSLNKNASRYFNIRDGSNDSDNGDDDDVNSLKSEDIYDI
jgi:initiation factor 1A